MPQKRLSAVDDKFPAFFKDWTATVRLKLSASYGFDQDVASLSLLLNEFRGHAPVIRMAPPVAAVAFGVKAISRADAGQQAQPLVKLFFDWFGDHIEAFQVDIELSELISASVDQKRRN